jgi:hypothetical protein
MFSHAAVVHPLPINTFFHNRKNYPIPTLLPFTALISLPAAFSMDFTFRKANE